MPAWTSSATATALREFGGAITWKRIVVTAVITLVTAALIHPIFITPFSGVLWEMLVVAWLVLLAYTAAGVWQPPGVPRWLNQVLAVALGTPLATLLLYMGLVGGQWTRFVENRGLVRGYFILTGIVLSIAPLIALVALYRERDAQARNQQLRFELEKSTLERQALDARLKLLHAQIEPHFLFNTLANVQELVESGSEQAGAVLQHLIAYLRGAMPQLHDEQATLGNEAALVRAYLELMHMRMPDRLRFAIDLPADLADLRFPTMALLTLVENAIHHGIDPAEQGGTVEVRGRRDADGLVHVAVTDSGAGMRESAAPGTGLANLRARLAAFYGATARLELSEVRPHGVRAELVFDPAAPAAPAADAAHPPAGAPA